MMGITLLKGLLQQNALLFKGILKISAGASFIILVIILLKKIIKDGFSPQWHYFVWLLVLIKLLLPFSITSSLSINNLLVDLPQSSVQPEPVNRIEQRFIPVQDSILPESEPIPKNPISPSQAWPGAEEARNWPHGIQPTYWELLGVLWLAGMLLVCCSGFYSYGKIRRNVESEGSDLAPWVQREFKSLLQEEGIMQRVRLQGVNSFYQPFVMGILRPRIILPTEIVNGLEEPQLRAILRHELQHIKWQDHSIRILMLLAQGLHWFNPLVWLAFHHMIRDCESACDARVIRKYSQEERREYAATLLKMASLKQQKVGLRGLAFGESNFRKRVMDVVKFKRYSMIARAASVMLVIVLGVTLLTEAKEPKTLKDVEPIIKPGIEQTFDQAVGEAVEGILEKILAEGQLSSDPYNYINEHQAVDDLVELGYAALDYMLGSFEKANEDGLREYVMAIACAKIIGVYDEERGIGINSGREWFYKYKEVIKPEEQFSLVDADRDLFLGEEIRDQIIYPNSIDTKDLEEVVSYYILARNRLRYYHLGEKAIEAHKIHRIEEKGNQVTLYMEVAFSWYGFENGYFTPVSGSGLTPVVMVLQQNEGHYEVVDYQEPMDGSMWGTSIRQLFPDDIAAIILANNKERIGELMEIQRMKARDYLQEIGRPDTEIKDFVDKDRDDQEKNRAIALVTNIRTFFPNWEGTTEILLGTGGKHPGAAIRALLETRCFEVEEGVYEVLLTKTWQAEINGTQPISYWRYRVTGGRMELIEEENNDDSIKIIK